MDLFDPTFASWRLCVGCLFWLSVVAVFQTFFVQEGFDRNVVGAYRDFIDDLKRITKSDGKGVGANLGQDPVVITLAKSQAKSF